jgi:hypothetical protein
MAKEICRMRRLEESQLLSVAEDIEYLRDTWADGASDGDLRRGSALLRRFLIDGGNGILIVVWHLLGLPGQPRVKAPSLPPQILAAGSKVDWVFRSIRPVISFHSGHVFR